MSCKIEHGLNLQASKGTRLKRLSVFKACTLPSKNWLKDLIWLKNFCETPERRLRDYQKTPRNSCKTPKRFLWDSQEMPKRIVSKETPERVLKDYWQIPERFLKIS